MSEKDEMRALAEAHGCGYEDIPVRETSGIYKRVYTPVRPVPCVRDENGEIAGQTVKRLFGKINEELDELKDAVLTLHGMHNKMQESDMLRHTADEAADTVTAITTLCNALGIDAEMRNEAQRRVNRKNLERGRL